MILDRPPGPPRGVAARCDPLHPADGARPAKALWAAVVVLLGVCLGCATPWGTPRPIEYESDGLRRLMEQLGAVNADLTGVKGLGRVTVTVDGSERTFERTVWAGAAPGRLRFAFRAPTGMPILSMSCDEQWLTALHHTEGDYYRRRIGSGRLSQFLPVQITCADLYGLMVGRAPGVLHDAVNLDSAAQSPPGEVVLLLKRRLRGTVGRLRLDRETGILRAVELFDVHGNRQYEARLEAIRTIDGYRLPGRIRLVGPEGWLVLEAARLWPAQDLDASLFHIPPPVE